MRLYAALDVPLKKTAVCVMDHDGRLVREVEVATCPDALAAVLCAYEGRLERVGLEAGPMSEWLARGLAGHGIAAVLMETRRARKALSAMTVKTDRNDARGLAHLLRMGWFRPVHVKAVSAREQRARLAARETLVRQLRDLENSARGLLRGFGLRVPPPSCGAGGPTRSAPWSRATRACPPSSSRCCGRARRCASSSAPSTGRSGMPLVMIRSADG
jgi:transposase